MKIQQRTNEELNMIERIHHRLPKKIGLSTLVVMMGLSPFLAIASKDPLKPPKKFKDYGTRGHIFPIKERSLLEVIEEKLKLAQKNGTIKNLQGQFQEKVKQKISHPNPVSGIRHTVAPSWHTFDPTYTQSATVKDHLGKVIVKKGTTVNPLDHIAWGEPLIFIDGEEASHINWAMQQEGKIIIVKGAPLELHQKYNRWFYFDQAGLLTKRFAITQVPARVIQDGKVLKIEEIKL